MFVVIFYIDSRRQYAIQNVYSYFFKLSIISLVEYYLSAIF